MDDPPGPAVNNGTPSAAQPGAQVPQGPAISGISALLLGNGSIEKVFLEIDSDKDGIIDENELRDGLAAMGVQLSPDEFKRFEDEKQGSDLKIDLETFKRIVENNPGIGQFNDLTMWLKSLKLFEVFECWFSDYLRNSRLPSADSDGLDSVRALEEHDLHAAVHAIQDKIVLRLHEGVHRLRAEKKARESYQQKNTVTPNNDKFAMTSGGAAPSELQFGVLQDFYKGLEAVIGLPNPRVMAGMRGEHCGREDSRLFFATSNYALSTCPHTEWEFVVEPAAHREYPGEKPQNHTHMLRRRKTLHELMALPQIQAAGLTKEEAVALRLYTGPMFVKYNAVLRGFPEETVADLRGNRYVTTLHTIVSGIVKLSRVERVPPGRLVYRGLGGMMLPECYWREDAFGCRGGVELAFMSTTTNRDVAVQYSGDGDYATIFEISVGQVDRGASLSCLSQYEGEDEILFPPLSNLEVVGSPWMDRGCVVIPLKVNVNLKGVTIDELIARRKVLHGAMLDNLLAETKLASETQSRMVSRHHKQLASRLCDIQAATSLLAEIRQRYIDHRSIPAETYNSDRHYKEIIDDAVDAKADTLFLQLAVACKLNAIASDLWGCSPCPKPSDDFDAMRAQRRAAAAAHAPANTQGAKTKRSSVDDGQGGAVPKADTEEADGAVVGRSKSDVGAGKPAAAQLRRRSSVTVRKKNMQKLPPVLLDLWRKSAGVVAGRVAGARLTVPPAANLPPIAAVDLTGCGLGPHGAAALSRGLTESWSAPHTLLLGANRIERGGLAALLSVVEEKTALRGALQKLHLEDNELDSDAIEMLPRPLAACTRLTDLSLASNVLRAHPTTDPPLLALVSGLPRLQALDLSHGSLEPRSAYLVAKALAEHCSLTAVNRCRLPARNAAERLRWAGRERGREVRRDKESLRVLISESGQEVSVMEGAGGVCVNCNQAEERHYGPLRACYAPVYTRGTDERCAHCGRRQREDGGVLTHFTEFEFCWDEGRRRAVQEAKRARHFQFQLEEDLGKGKTPLMEAVEGGDIPRALGLLAARANVNAADSLSRTPLLVAAAQQRAAVTRCLLAHQGDVSCRDRGGQTLLAVAASHGSEAVLRELLGAAGGPALLLETADDGRTALHWAAERRMEEVCKEMVALGGRDLLAVTDNNGRSCLEMAAQHGLGELCVTVMALGGKQVALLRPAQGRSCLHWAVENELVAVCKEMVEVGGAELLLLRAGDGETALHRAAGRGNQELCEVLIAGGGSELVWVRAADGTTALHWAAGRGLAGVCERLVEVGGTELLLAQGEDGRSALHWAAGSGQGEVCTLLCSHGGSELVRLQARDGWTALHWAAGAGMEAECAAMMKVGGREVVLLAARDGASCLHRAAWRGAEATCREMVERGGRELLLMQGGDGRSALHVAVTGGMEALSSHMVAAGGRELVLLRDESGSTALHAAAAQGRLELCKLVVEAGGTEVVMVTGKDGRSCLHWAAAAGAAGLCRYLGEHGGRGLVTLADKQRQTALELARGRRDGGGVNAAVHALTELSSQYSV